MSTSRTTRRRGPATRRGSSRTSVRRFAARGERVRPGAGAGRVRLETDVAVTLGIFDLGLEFDSDIVRVDVPGEPRRHRRHELERGRRALRATRGRTSLPDGPLGRAGIRGAQPRHRRRPLGALDTGGAHRPRRRPASTRTGASSSDVRHATYTNVPDSTGTSDESFWNPYLALIWTPRKNVEVRARLRRESDDATPTSPVEGRGNGSERWRVAVPVGPQRRATWSTPSAPSRTRGSSASWR